MSDTQSLTADLDGIVQVKKPASPPGMGGFTRLPSVKFVMIGLISLILLVPAMLVWALVEERADRATEVSARIANGWGGPQLINGPYLAVPVSYARQTVTNGVTSNYTQVDWALVMPEELSIDAKLEAESRKLSIYSLPVYNGKLAIKGRFAARAVDDLRALGGTPDISGAVMVMNIADITGIRSNAEVAIDGAKPVSFEPGMKGMTALPYGNYDPYSAQATGLSTGSGVYAAIDQAAVGRGFAFDIALSLNGSSRFAVAPAGQTTSLSVAANWADPGFEGRFLPEDKTITKDGFDARWTIPFLARGVDRAVAGSSLPLSDSLMVVNLVEPVKFYQLIARTLKYAIGFISVVFLAVFIIELKGGRMVHSVQYVLTGLALVIFYILLLALAEHTGFEIAYGVAATAVTLLISFYVGSATMSRRSGTAIGIVLALSYAIMYLIMREDEYALLAGALMAFVTIATTMYFTRNIDWSGGRDVKQQA